MTTFGVLAGNADKLIGQGAIFVLGFLLAWWMRGALARFQHRRFLKTLPHDPE